MKKSYLFTPGPTPVPEEVRLAMAKASFHHRTPYFRHLLLQVTEQLQRLMGTTNPVFLFASSGTGAMESAVANLLSPGETALYVQAGKFGQRWGEIGRAYGAKMVEIAVPWGEAVSWPAVEKALTEHPEAVALFLQACETSTGVRHPVEEIAPKLKGRSLLLVVDAITALGVWPLPMNELGIDVLLGGSQKALMLPPGLSFVAVSERAREKAAQNSSPRYYWDWRKMEKALSKGNTPFTPATSLVAGLAKALELLEAEGLEQVYARHRRLAELTRSRVQQMGLDLFPSAPAPGLTVVNAPSGVTSSQIIEALKTEYGITLANGQEHLKDKIFRIAHMGYFSEADILLVTSALEVVLKRLLEQR